MRRASAWLFVALLFASWALPAFAHAIGISRGEYTRTARGFDAKLVLARPEVLATLPELDVNHDADLDAGELRNGRKRLDALTRAALTARQETQACAPVDTHAELTAEDGIGLSASFECPTPTAPIRIELDFLRRVAAGHRHRATYGTSEAVLFGATASFELAAHDTPGQTSSSMLEFLRMGFEHILSGADHLAFLLALALGARRLKGLVRVITAFTLGHSLSLAAVAFKLWAPSSAWVEPAIALSVVYVAFENFRGAAPERRAWASFGFGLVHGMGFASALNEIGLSRDELPRALLSFNLGVELAQLLLVGATVALLLRARQHSWFEGRAAPALSLLLAGCGLVWFVARVT